MVSVSSEPLLQDAQRALQAQELPADDAVAAVTRLPSTTPALAKVMGATQMAADVESLSGPELGVDVA